MNRLPRFREGHTRRHAVHLGRRFAPRVGHHPRDPARPAHAEPTAKMPAVVPRPDGRRQELGREGGERVVEEARRRQAEDTGSRRADGVDDVDRPDDPGAASSSDPARKVAT